MRVPIITNLKAWIDHRTVRHLPAVGLSRQCAYRGGKCDNERYARTLAPSGPWAAPVP
jgi:hypothetical protein